MQHLSKKPTKPLAQYIMVGGFLGAGKTTAILKLAQHLKAHGRTVGLITNDQAAGLVDTQMERAEGFPVEEIAGGCFCCRFNSLVDASQRLAKVAQPDVFIAEPVGSCTDIMATVTIPMQKLYGDRYRLAPLTVLVDPNRIQRVLGIGGGQPFAPKVIYIYLKQLEEANIIVINKCDRIGTTELKNLQNTLAKKFPHAEVMTISARHGTGMEAWFDRVLSGELAASGIVDIDYLTYGAGEAMLGWLNATAQIQAKHAVDGNQLLQEIAQFLQKQLVALSAEVAHLKMALAGSDHDMAVVNLVSTDATPEQSLRLSQPITNGVLTLNLRAETTPDVLETIVRSLPAHMGHEHEIELTLMGLESFKPGQPNPTHRMDSDGVTHRPILKE